MTFTEAAVEVLRRAGKPLHYTEIADVALRANLLSHVGQDPEITMGQRLAAMAKREDDRKVVAVLPEGTFALIEWSVPQEAQGEPVPPPMQPAETGEPLYRPREREPRAIHAQARRRLAELQAEHEEGYEEVEAERRRQDQGRKGQRRFPPPAEVVFEALAERQSGSALAELAADLLRRELLSDALVRDLPSLVAALLEDNRRRTEAGRKPAFIVDGDRVTLVEFPPASALLEEVRAPHGGARPMGAAQGPGALLRADGARARSGRRGTRRPERGERGSAGAGRAVRRRSLAGGDDRLPGGRDGPDRRGAGSRRGLLRRPFAPAGRARRPPRARGPGPRGAGGSCVGSARGLSGSVARRRASAHGGGADCSRGCPAGTCRPGRRGRRAARSAPPPRTRGSPARDQRRRASLGTACGHAALRSAARTDCGLIDHTAPRGSFRGGAGRGACGRRTPRGGAGG